MKSIKVKKVNLKKISFLVFPIGKIRMLIFLFFILFNCISVSAQDVNSNTSGIYISEGTEVVGLNDFVFENEKGKITNTSDVVYVTKGTKFFVSSESLHNIDNVIYVDDSSQKAYVVSQKVDVKSKVQRKVEQNTPVTCCLNNVPFKSPFSFYFQTNKFVVVSTTSNFSFQKISCQQIVVFSLDRFVITVSKPKIKLSEFNIIYDKIVNKFTTRPPPSLSKLS